MAKVDTCSIAVFMYINYRGSLVLSAPLKVSVFFAHQRSREEQVLHNSPGNAPAGLIRFSDLEEALKVYLRKVSHAEISELMKQFDDCTVYLPNVVDSDGLPVPFFRYQDYINLMMRRS